jgi:hypothetical protein
VHPAVRVDRLGGLARLVPVAEHHRVAARAQLARLAARTTAPVSGDDDLHLDVRERAPDGLRPALERVVAPVSVETGDVSVIP